MIVIIGSEEREDFWVMMIETLSSIGPGERVLIGGYLNGHVGAESSGYEDVHGGFGFGDRYVEGEMILESAEAMGMIFANTQCLKCGWTVMDGIQALIFEAGRRPAT